MEDVVLDIHNVEQFMSLENIGQKIKSMIIDEEIKDNGDGTVSLTFILDKNKGKE